MENEQQYEGQQASHAVALLCKMFVEKTVREQQELTAAANSAEPTRQQEGWQLNIERGLWVRPYTPPQRQQGLPLVSEFSTLPDEITTDVKKIEGL